MKLLTFNIYHDLPDITVDVNPSFVETVLDGSYLKAGSSMTQITMVSGSKFFVQESKDAVKKAIEDVLNGIS